MSVSEHLNSLFSRAAMAAFGWMNRRNIKEISNCSKEIIMPSK